MPTSYNFESAKTEYIILREEIQHLFDSKSKLKTTLFSIYSIILAYLLSHEQVNPLYFLTPIPLIFLFFLLDYDISLYIWRSASYCIIYFSEYNFLWEKRLSIYRDKYKDEDCKKENSYLSTLFIYYILIIICLFLCINDSKSNIKHIIICIFIAIISFIFLFYRNKIYMERHQEVFEKEKQKWRAVKDLELKQNSSTL